MVTISKMSSLISTYHKWMNDKYPNNNLLMRDVYLIGQLEALTNVKY